MLWFLVGVLVIIAYISLDDLETEFLEFGSHTRCVGIIASVHGNEPAGLWALQQLPRVWFEKFGIRVKIIRNPNPYGILLGTRWYGVRDLNRAFTEHPDMVQAQKILDFFQDCEAILDIHEGWSWHKINPASVGSTIRGTPGVDDLVSRMVEAQNIHISDPMKQFMVSEDASDHIYATLSWYYTHIQKKTHVLVEISGQNGIQTPEIRTQQAIIAIREFLTYYSKKVDSENQI